MAKNRETAKMVFRRSSHIDLSEHKGNIQVFNILLALDGKRTVEAIAREDFYELDVLTAKMEEMLVNGFIEPAGGSESGPSGNVDQVFFNQLSAELTQMVGPVAGMLVKEAAENAGHSVGNFPLSKAGELLSELAKFIQDPAKAADFQRRMRSLAENRH